MGGEGNKSAIKDPNNFVFWISPDYGKSNLALLFVKDLFKAVLASDQFWESTSYGHILKWTVWMQNLWA